MKHLWRVALYEYQRNVFKKSFILLMLSVPFFITFSIGLGVFLESLEDNSLPVGYVDHAGVFDRHSQRTGNHFNLDRKI